MCVDDVADICGCVDVLMEFPEFPLEFTFCSCWFVLDLIYKYKCDWGVLVNSVSAFRV